MALEPLPSVKQRTGGRLRARKCVLARVQHEQEREDRFLRARRMQRRGSRGGFRTLGNLYE